MALQFKVSTSPYDEDYENATLTVVDTFDFPLEEIEASSLVVNENLPFTIQNQEIKSHYFEISGNIARQYFGDDPSELPDLAQLWDFSDTLYAAGSTAMIEEVVYENDGTREFTSQDEYEDAFMYHGQWPSSDQWSWKFYQVFESNGQINFIRNFPFTAEGDPSLRPYTNPFVGKIVALKEEYAENMIFWINEHRSFGLSRFWDIENNSAYTAHKAKSYQRLFGSAVSFSPGYALDVPPMFNYRYWNDNSEYDTFPFAYPSEFTASGYTNDIFHTDITEPVPNQPTHSRVIILEYDYNGTRYYGLAAVSYIENNPPFPQECTIDRIKVYGVSENFFEGAQPEPEPEEDGEEEEGGNGIRPATVHQYPSDGLMGLNFDLGLSRVNTGIRGLKLTYMPVATLNQYVDNYISRKMNLLPETPSLADEIINCLLMPATQAIMQNCYDTIIDVYKIPYTPSGMTSNERFNIGGMQLSIPGARVFNGFAQKQTIEMGRVALPEIFGSYLDYAPNISAQIWLPFCGMYQIPINAFMGGELVLKYIIDLLTGSCTAYLFGTDRSHHQTLIGSFGGDMKLPVPLGITAANTTIIGQALRGGLMSISQTPTKPFLTTRMAQENVGRGLEAYNFLQGEPDIPNVVGTGLQTGFGALGKFETGLKQTGKNVIGGVAKGAQFISQLRESTPVLSGVIGQVGGVSGWCGWMQPYVRIDAPVRKNPEGYTYYLGKPANVKKLIGELGDGTLNKANAPRLNIPGALPQELDEIYSILTTGFYK